MNSTMTDRQLQLRKVAILVATLEEPLAERLLADMPSREAAEVQILVSELGAIDPAEYRAVVADFRRGLDAQSQLFPPPEPQTAQTDGVELDESLLAMIETQEDSAMLPAAGAESATWNALSDADADILAEMLSAEQPQTVAVVLSRLDPERAAALIAKLSPALQAEVLTRLAELDPADQQSLQVVESQLASWIAQQRDRQQRMAAGRDMVERILQSTPENQRNALLTQMSKRDLALAAEMSARSSVRRQTSTSAHEPMRVSRPLPTIAETPTPIAAVHATEEPEAADDPLSELEALDDSSLLNALRHSDREVVMLALAGASEGLMKRILRGLPRRQANQFRQQVRAIGPTRLGDMLAAQRELVRRSRNTVAH